MSSDAQPPREPSAYRPTLHFKERFEDAFDEHRRHLDGEIVRRCITDGEVVTQGRNAVRFVEDIEGVTYAIVVNPRSRCVASGYPVSLDWTSAAESGRWTESQLEDINAFLADSPR